MKVSSLLPRCGFHRSNSGGLTLWQSPLPNKLFSLALGSQSWVGKCNSIEFKNVTAVPFVTLRSDLLTQPTSSSNCVHVCVRARVRACVYVFGVQVCIHIGAELSYQALRTSDALL